MFSQLLDFLPCLRIQKCVARYEGDHKVQKFSCYDQFIAMAFAQLTQCDSLRDIETCLQSIGKKALSHAVRPQGDKIHSC